MRELCGVVIVFVQGIEISTADLRIRADFELATQRHKSDR